MGSHSDDEDLYPPEYLFDPRPWLSETQDPGESKTEMLRTANYKKVATKLGCHIRIGLPNWLRKTKQWKRQNRGSNVYDGLIVGVTMKSVRVQADPNDESAWLPLGWIDIMEVWK